jgi:hypothetical protein
VKDIVITEIRREREGNEEKYKFYVSKSLVEPKDEDRMEKEGFFEAEEVKRVPEK